MLIGLPRWLSSVKNLPDKRETQLPSLGQKDPLEEEMAMHSNIVAWENPRTEEPGLLQSMGLQRVDMTKQLNNILPTTQSFCKCIILCHSRTLL